jgi:hypothetical protein
MYLNKEPYSDMHLIFPTRKDINTIRSNYMFMDFIVNDWDLQIDDVIIRPHQDGIDQQTVSKYDKASKYEAYVKDTRTMFFRKKCESKACYPGDARCTQNSFTYEDCMFQPPDVMKGAIARSIFYFLLMYGNSSKRPYTKHEPWLHRYEFDEKFNFKNLNINDHMWKKFFGNMRMFQRWARKYPVQEYEVLRNKDIEKFTGVPNIFIGYNGSPVVDSNDLINHLFFDSDPNKCHAVCDITFYGSDATEYQLPPSMDNHIIPLKHIGNVKNNGYVEFTHDNIKYIRAPYQTSSKLVQTNTKDGRCGLPPYQMVQPPQKPTPINTALSSPILPATAEPVATPDLLPELRPLPSPSPLPVPEFALVRPSPDSSPAKKIRQNYGGNKKYKLVRHAYNFFF